MSPSAEATALLVTLNGESVELAAGSTAANVVERFAGGARMVALERNGEIVPRSRWGATPLAVGDRVELVRFVQGG